jgi:hypothetical protein
LTTGGIGERQAIDVHAAHHMAHVEPSGADLRRRDIE